MRAPKGYYAPRIAVFSLSVTGAYAIVDTVQGQLRLRREAGKWFDDWDRVPELPEEPSTPSEQALAVALRMRAAEKRSERVGRRYVILVRHAQPPPGGADPTPSKPALSSVGRMQAELTGRRLQEIFGKGKLARGVSVVYHSPAPEAAATADIIRGCFAGCGLLESSLLAEGVPAVPSPTPQALEGLDAEELELDLAGAEGAFRAHLWRPTGADQDNISVDVLVSHGNLIRYLVCRGLQLPTAAWGRLATNNCAVTWLDISADGAVALREFGGVGHLPPDLVTYH